MRDAQWGATNHQHTNRYLRIDVRWCTPILLQDTVGNLDQLGEEAGGKLAVATWILNWYELFPIILQTSYFLLYVGILRTLSPCLPPVDIRRRCRGCPNRLQHPL